MKYFGNGLSEQHKELQAIIRNQGRWPDAKRLFLSLHAKLHTGAVSATEKNEVDALLGDLAPQEYAIMPTAKDETIAWVLWHVARIEDVTMNILVTNRRQVFDGEWARRIGAPITDTGNALTDDEIMALSHEINSKELVAYRGAVGRSTREMVESLSAGDMVRKVSAQGLENIRQAGGVTEQEESLWLLDFWGKKDVAGLLLMPPTRHVLLHLNDCCRAFSRAQRWYAAPPLWYTDWY